MNSDALSARIGNLLGSSVSSSAENCPATPPPPVPDHQIIARIGSGSYGEVWLARSITGALRAVKVVWRFRFSSERLYEREFHGIVQFEPISRSHPGVVNVLHVGRDDAAGCFFYVMELADNAHAQSETRNADWSEGAPPSAPSAGGIPYSYSPRTLASELKRTRLPIADAVSLGVQLAGALGHLHRHGLVHRDVKPSNVIFVHGQAKLADIGLVTGIHEERSFVGTEGYIPPEGPGSERADLFGLGRLLYEAATGKNRCDFPGLPDDRWPKGELEGLIELNEVLTRVCAPEAKKRHSNAAELAGDLNLILAGRSVRRAYRLERQLRHATWVSVTALILVVAAVCSNWLQRRQREISDTHARREAALRQQTEKSLARAEAAEKESRQQLYTALLEQARTAVLTGEVGHRVRALDAVHRASAISNSAALRGVAITALGLPDLRFKREWPGTPDTTMAILDPPFERIALCAGGGPVEIRSVTDQRLLATLPASTNLAAYEGSWSPDGRFLAVSRDHDSAASRRALEVWEIADAKRVLLLPDTPWGAMSFHPLLPRMIAGGAPATAVIWNLETGEELTRHSLEGRPVVLKFSPDGQRFATLFQSAEGWVVAIHDAADGTRGTRHIFADRVRELAWHPNGRALAVPDFSGAVHRMDAQTGEARELGRHKAAAVRTFFSPDGAYLFSSGWDRQVICWDVKAMRRAFTVALESYVLQFRTDGKKCAFFVRPDMRLHLHAFEHPSLCREFAEDLGGGRNYAAFSPDGRWLAGHGEERLVLWDLAGDSPPAVVNDPANTRVNFAGNGELFTSRPGDCVRWRVKADTNGAPPALERLALPTPAGFVSLSLLSDGVVFTSTKGSKRADFDQLGTDQGAWKPTADGLNGVSPDGQWLGMFRSYTSEFYAYRLPGFERVAVLTAGGRISQFEFSPQGGEVAVAGRGGIEFWSTTNWQRTRCLTNFSNLLYSPDGRTFWLSRDWRIAGLHDAATGELLLPLPPNTLPLAVSPDGAASVNLRHVQVWDLAEMQLRLRELGLE
jgi:serine/threonine protein kinase/WD40 repeat protein